MPRYYRRRYTRVVRPKKKWASNIATWVNESVTGVPAVSLASNNIQAANPTPTILKVGNFKVSADLTFTATQTATGYIPAVVAYILYVPEGWPTGEAASFNNLIRSHPEWIMATKTMGANSRIDSVFPVDTLNMSTRLKRNLNSGDKIYLYFNFNTTATISSITITGTCRYWTCAN